MGATALLNVGRLVEEKQVKHNKNVVKANIAHGERSLVQQSPPPPIHLQTPFCGSNREEYDIRFVMTASGSPPSMSTTNPNAAGAAVVLCLPRETKEEEDDDDDDEKKRIPKRFRPLNYYVVVPKSN